MLESVFRTYSSGWLFLRKATGRFMTMPFMPLPLSPFAETRFWGPMAVTGFSIPPPPLEGRNEGGQVQNRARRVFRNSRQPVSFRKWKEWGSWDRSGGSREVSARDLAQFIFASNKPPSRNEERMVRANAPTTVWAIWASIPNEIQVVALDSISPNPT